MAASTGPYCIEGLKTGFNGSTPPPRREIRELYKNSPEQFNLYLLALSEIQQMPHSERLSYFQLAGIHGVPWVDWDGVEGRLGKVPYYDKSTKKFKDSNGGYCVHESILFPTWHRPYMMLFEQVLGRKMVDIAKQFPVALRDKYVKAAEAWRLPYWDWLVRPDPEYSSVTMPTFVSGYDPEEGSFNHPNIEVLRPNGKIESMPNPLFSFTFKPSGVKFDEIPYSQYMTEKSPLDRTRRGENLDKVLSEQEKLQSASKQTVDSKTDQNQSTNGHLARAYNRRLVDYSKNLLDLLLYCDMYQQYASKKYNAQFEYIISKGGAEIPKTSSIEAIHDVIHQNGGAFLARLQEAAFDPLFWLHHCNIDRWQAFWEALHPNVPFTESQEEWEKKYGQRYATAHPQGISAAANLPDGKSWAEYTEAKTASTYFLDPNAVVTESTELKPFHCSADKFWTSKMCRTLNGLGYSYPELARKEGESDQDFRLRLITQIRALYEYDEVSAFDAGGWPGKDPATNKPLTTKQEHRPSNVQNMKMLEIPSNYEKPLKAPETMYRDAALLQSPAAAAPKPEPAPPRWPAPPVVPQLKPLETPSHRRYSITLRVEQYALNAGFGVYFFLGPIPSELEKIYVAPNLAANVVVLADDAQFVSGCANCAENIENRGMVSDTTNITNKLLKAADPNQNPTLPPLKDMTEASVVQYLKQHLGWRIVQFKDDKYSIVDNKDTRLGSLAIVVQSQQEVAPDRAKGELLPSLKGLKSHVEATADKVGGFKG